MLTDHHLGLTTRKDWSPPKGADVKEISWTNYDGYLIPKESYLWSGCDVIRFIDDHFLARCPSPEHSHAGVLASQYHRSIQEYADRYNRVLAKAWEPDDNEEEWI